MFKSTIFGYSADDFYIIAFFPTTLGVSLGFIGIKYVGSVD